MQTIGEYKWVFIGCGGTLFAASPYLSVLLRRYCKTTSILIDPDVVEKGNQNRQWPGSTVGVPKVFEAHRSLALDDTVRFESRFSPHDEVLGRLTDGHPVLAIVNVDNDRTRLQVADWLESRQSPGIMIVSGCEKDKGQAYPGIWNDGEAIFDWRETHCDVGGEEGPQNPCNLQDIRANALTGTLVGLCLEDVIGRLGRTNQEFPPQIREFYWASQENGSVRMWTVLARCEEVVS